MLKYNFKFLSFIIVCFICCFTFMNDVSANQASCTYTGNLSEFGDYKITIGLDDKGYFYIKDEIYEKGNCSQRNTYSCEYKNTNSQTKDSTSKKVVLNFKSNDFSKNNDLITKCPNLYATVKKENKVKYYYIGAEQKKANEEITAVYFGFSKDSVKLNEKEENKPLLKRKIYSTKKMTLTSQYLNRGDKFYLNDKVENNANSKQCKYRTVDGENAVLVTANDKTWVTNFDINGVKIVDFENQGQLSDLTCDNELYLSCEQNSSEKLKKCYITKEKTGKYSFEKKLINYGNLTDIGDPKLDGSFLGIIDGCAMLGSLGVLGKELFTILQVVSLALLIILSMLDFSKAAASGDDNAMKKAFQSLIKRIIVVVVLFILPVLISWILNLFPEIGDECIKEFGK